MRLVVHHRAVRTASHRQGTATTRPSIQCSTTEVWGIADVEGHPEADGDGGHGQRTREVRPVGPDVDQDLLARPELEPIDGQGPQPSLPAIDPAERRTVPSAPAAE